MSLRLSEPPRRTKDMRQKARETVILSEAKDLNESTFCGFTWVEILRASSSDALRMTTFLRYQSFQLCGPVRSAD